MQNPHINTNNIVNEIVKNIKHYPSERIYKMRYSNYYTFFDIRIEDRIAYSYFDNEEASSSSAFEFNANIKKTGKYRIFYKMYPVGKINNEVFSTLRDNSYLDFTIKSYDLKNENADDITYFNYKTPMDSIKISEKYSEEKFVGAGKTYYEGSFDVNVEVPYEIHPVYEKAKDLRKMDNKELQAKLLQAYQQVWNIYNNKEYDNIARISFDTWKDEFASLYKTDKEVSETWSTFLSIYKSDSFEMQPLEDYKLEFFANGKLVALMSTNDDFRNRGNTALWAKVNHEGLRPFFINRYFYIPEGETEFKVY